MKQCIRYFSWKRCMYLSTATNFRFSISQKYRNITQAKKNEDELDKSVRLSYYRQSMMIRNKCKKAATLVQQTK